MYTVRIEQFLIQCLLQEIDASISLKNFIKLSTLNCLYSMKLTFVVKFLIREYCVTFAETAKYAYMFCEKNVKKRFVNKRTNKHGHVFCCMMPDLLVLSD